MSDYYHATNMSECELCGGEDVSDRQGCFKCGECGLTFP